MFRRRRPLLRAAAVGTAGYAVGRHMANQQQEEEYAEEPVGLGPDAYDELQKLAKLKDQGILTQDEFDEQKAKILNAS
jgi:hypothetical protein